MHAHKSEEFSQTSGNNISALYINVLCTLLSFALYKFHYSIVLSFIIAFEHASFSWNNVQEYFFRKTIFFCDTLSLTSSS